MRVAICSPKYPGYRYDHEKREELDEATRSFVAHFLGLPAAYFKGWVKIGEDIMPLLEDESVGADKLYILDPEDVKLPSDYPVKW